MEMGNQSSVLSRLSDYKIQIIIAIVALVIVPLFAPNHIQSILSRAIILAIFAMGLDILIGYTGLTSLGHAAYFGAGGYTLAMLFIHFDVTSFWLNVPLAMLCVALLSAVFGLIALRVSDEYFLIITFALGQLVHSFFVTGLPLAGGWYGLAGVTRPQLGIPNFTWTATYYYFFTILMCVAAYLILKKFTTSPFGLALQGIRENKARMESLGYNVFLHKYVAFIVSGTVAGFAGILFVYLNGIISPTHVGLTYSSLALLIVIIGGAGTLYGPIFGAIVVVLIEYYASLFIPDRWPLILGGFFVVAVMYARGGIGPFANQLLKRRVQPVWKR